MIKRLIATIRRKPRAVRETIAVWTAGSLTALVVMVWLYHLPSRFDTVDLSLKQTDADRNYFDEFKSQLSATREAVSSPVQEGGEEQVLDSMIQAYREQEQADADRMNTPTSTATSSAEVRTAPPSQPIGTSSQPQSIRISTTSEAAASSSQTSE